MLADYWRKWKETTMMMTLQAEADFGEQIMEENCQLIRASTMNCKFPAVLLRSRNIMAKT